MNCIEKTRKEFKTAEVEKIAFLKNLMNVNNNELWQTEYTLFLRECFAIRNAYLELFVTLQFSSNLPYRENNPDFDAESLGYFVLMCLPNSMIHSSTHKKKTTSELPYIHKQ